ncbi:MAG: hypothetical protein ABSG54_15305 [Terriglobia bacterium]|jgi:hypothetical protein
MRRNRRFRFVLILLALVSTVPGIATAGDRQFDAIVERLRSHYHKSPVRMLGFASFAANRFYVGGAKNMRIAVFEDLDPALNPPAGDFDAFMQQIAGSEFRPLVRVVSRRDGEQTFIYARPTGDDFEMLIVSLEGDEASVVKIRMSPDAMSRWVEKPDEMAAKSAAHPDDNSEP